MTDGTQRGASISLRGLSKLYGSVAGVRRLDFDIDAGEFVTFLGPSGSGKSTTLMMVAGFETPTTGEILVGGRSMLNLPAHKRNLGMVFQQYSLFPHLNVFHNVAFPLTIRGRPDREIRDRVGAALKLVRLEDFGHRRTNEISGGQQQRVALARALVFNPAVLLLDEPLAALDLKLRQELQVEIKRVHSETGVTVIYVTHDQGEALSMSDRIVVMNHGAVQQIGTPEEIYCRPANDFVAEFIGDSNRLNGTLVANGGGAAAVKLPSGHLIRARAGQRQLGESVVAVVRPESIVRVDHAMAQDNRFEGRVLSSRYLGDVTRCSVGIAPDLVLTAAWQNRSGPSRLTEGETVTVGWAASDTIILN